jgi:hypothetical protein
MAVIPVDRIRTMITDLERGARTLGDDIRKRAGNVKVTSDIETALRQVLLGLTNIAAQLERAAGELRRYLEAGAKGGKGRRSKARKPAAKRPAAKPARKKKASAKPAASARSTKPASKPSSKPATKPASKKSTARK